MTLIVGLNLSDRLYLASDTRVTFPDGTFKDDVIKISKLAGESFYFVGEKRPDPICVAVAGDMGLATFLFSNMREAIRAGNLPTDIRLLLTKVPEFVKTKVDEWLQMGRPYRACCFIFGGSHSARKKQIKLEILQKLKEKIRQNMASPEELQKVKAQLEKDPFFQELAKRIPKANLMRPFEEPDAILVNPLVQEAIDNGSNEINASDSLIFGLLIRKEGVSTEVAEWGEFLAYGTDGLTRNDLADEFLAMMELSTGQLVNQKDLMETQHLRGHILKIAQDKGIKQIGGTVTPTVIRDDLFQDVFGFTERSLEGKLLQGMYAQPDGIYYVRAGSTPIKMQRFHKYNVGETSAEL